MISNKCDFQIVLKPTIYLDQRKKITVLDNEAENDTTTVTELTLDEWKKQKSAKYQVNKKKEAVDEEIEMIIADPFYQSKLI